MAELTEFLNLVGGRKVRAGDRQTLESFDPFEGKPWAVIPRCTQGDVDAAVAAARSAFRSPAWGGLTPTQRGKLLFKLADSIEANADRLAAIETRDNGKLIAEMSTQLHYMPEWYRYYGGLADKRAPLPPRQQIRPST